MHQDPFYLPPRPVHPRSTVEASGGTASGSPVGTGQEIMNLWLTRFSQYSKWVDSLFDEPERRPDYGEIGSYVGVLDQALMNRATQAKRADSQSPTPVAAEPGDWKKRTLFPGPFCPEWLRWYSFIRDVRSTYGRHAKYGAKGGQVLHRKKGMKGASDSYVSYDRKLCEDLGGLLHSMRVAAAKMILQSFRGRSEMCMLPQDAAKFLEELVACSLPKAPRYA